MCIYSIIIHQDTAIKLQDFFPLRCLTFWHLAGRRKSEMWTTEVLKFKTATHITNKKHILYRLKTNKDI